MAEPILRDPAASTAEHSLAARVDIRALLEGDRRQAGEARHGAGQRELATTTYAPTAAERWHAFRLSHWYWFYGAGADRIRRGTLQALLAAVLGAGLAFGWAWLSPEPQVAEATAAPVPVRAEISASRVARAHRTVAASATERVPPAAASVPPLPERTEPGTPAGAAPSNDPKLAAWLDELSPRHRVVRADVLLENDHPVATRRARILLESAIAAGASGAHAQAALAETCLRLGDLGCAEDAAKRAIRKRPWRGGYRGLLYRVRRAAETH